jgi:tight adherence protein C
MFEATPIIVAVLMFCAVAAVILVLGRYVVAQASIQRRLPVPATATQPNAFRPPSSSMIGRLAAATIDEKKFGVDGPLRRKIRRDLIRAGFFSNQAIPSYVMWRLASILVFPILAFVAAEVFMPASGQLMKTGLAAVAVLVGIGAPDAYIARRQRLLVYQYRTVFPDLLDMLVVCVDAGLSMEAGFDRISGEISKQSRALGANLQIMGAEMRAGRSTVEALEGLADRLNLDEARVFGAMLRQSIELGSDLGDALRAYSDEMRAKRLLRAEEMANKLPVKLVIPLGTCIFPVILMVVMVPVIIRLIAIMQ